MSDDSNIFRPETGETSGSHSTKKPRQEQVYHFMVAAAAIVVVIAGIKSASGLVAPILLALFIAIILLVPLRWLRRKGCPNALALIIVLGGTIVVFSGISYLIGKSLNDFLLRLPAYKNRIVQKIEALDDRLEQFGFEIGKMVKEKIEPPQTDENDSAKPKQEISEPVAATKNGDTKTPEENKSESGAEGTAEEDATAEDEIVPVSSEEIERILKKDHSSVIALDSELVMYWVAKSMVELRHVLEGGFLVLIFTIFMIFEAARFPEKIDAAFGREGPIGNEHFHRIADDIRRYLFLKAISSLMSAVAATFVYSIFGVPGTLFWGVVAFFLYFIPNIGGTLAAIIPGLLIFMTYDLQGVLLYAMCLIAIECAIAYGIEPKMLGHGLGLSVVVILLSLFTWGWILGPIGLFLAAPLTIMVKIILQAFKETEWIAVLLSDKARNS